MDAPPGLDPAVGPIPAALALADLEAIRLILRGGSVIDWHRLNFEARAQIDAFVGVLELDLDDPEDRDRTERVKQAAIDYLRRNFDFPIPKPVERSSLVELMTLASGKGHRQLCACAILKVMHIIHHLESRELLYRLPMSDQDVFQMIEAKVYRVIGGMLAGGYPILEFIGGRKNRDSMYTKLLSKPETVAAAIYDKLRFRIVTRSLDDVFPVLDELTRRLFPFNYVTPHESKNTLFHFRSYCEEQEPLRDLFPRLQLSPDLEGDPDPRTDNRFTAPSFRTVHFVVDMPIRLERRLVPEDARHLGRIIFAQTEFQLVDRETEQANESGEASHDAYKRRQRVAVARRLKVGLEDDGGGSAAGGSPRPSRARRRSGRNPR
jgi:uncharacterized protein (TIGR04552 family)